MTLCDPIWHAGSCSSVSDSSTDCYIALPVHSREHLPAGALLADKPSRCPLPRRALLESLALASWPPAPPRSDDAAAAAAAGLKALFIL